MTNTPVDVNTAWEASTETTMALATNTPIGASIDALVVATIIFKILKEFSHYSLSALACHPLNSAKCLKLYTLLSLCVPLCTFINLLYLISENKQFKKF